MWRRYEAAIGQGCLTNSKHPVAYVNGIYPKIIKRAFGAHVYDHLGNKYLDYSCGLGTNLLGYANEHVLKAVDRVRDFGMCPSFPTIHEVELVDKFKEIFPFIEKAKFLKSGSEACSAAIRMARAFTGRDIVLSHGYHGWHDPFTSLTPPANGVPVNQSIYPLGKLTDINDTVAAVIIEPVILDDSRERKLYLNRLRERCSKYGTVLIFDEIITGLRYKNFSVSNDFNIRPDLICLGKAIGNGFPLSAVAGRADILDSPYFVSSTYGGEIWSLVAAKAVIETMQKKSSYNLKPLWAEGQQFIDGFNLMWPGFIKIEGYATRGVFEGAPQNIAIFFQECAKAGILFGKSWWMNFELAKHSNETLLVMRKVIERIQCGDVKLVGDIPKSPLSMKSRNIK